MYFGGGRLLNQNPTATVQILNLATLTFETSKTFSSGIARYGLAATTSSKGIYFAGGQASGTAYDTVDIYVSKLNYWRVGHLRFITYSKSLIFLVLAGMALQLCYMGKWLFLPVDFMLMALLLLS